MILEFLLTIPVIIVAFLGVTESVRVVSMRQSMRIVAFQAARELSFRLATERNFLLTPGAEISIDQENLENARWLDRQKGDVSATVMQSLSSMPLWMPVDSISGSTFSFSADSSTSGSIDGKFLLNGRVYVSLVGNQHVKVDIEICLPVLVFGFGDFLRGVEDSSRTKDANNQRGCVGQFLRDEQKLASFRFWRLRVSESFPFIPSYFIFRQGVAIPFQSKPFVLAEDPLTPRINQRAGALRARWGQEVHELIHKIR